MKTYKVEVYPNGNRFWYNKKNQLHREDGPAVERANGDKVWYIEGKKLIKEEYNFYYPIEQQPTPTHTNPFTFSHTPPPYHYTYISITYTPKI